MYFRKEIDVFQPFSEKGLNLQCQIEK